MLKLYDYLESLTIAAPVDNYITENKLIFFASDVMDALRISNTSDSEEAVNRAFKACLSNHIPLKQNFKRVYRFNGKEILPDWKVSALGCYLIIINADPGNPGVASAQLFFALK